MTSQHSWFRGPELRSIVFDAPTPSTWIVLKRVNEHEHRKDPDHSAVSYASVKYQCKKHGDASKIAFVRIYKQLPHLGTEFDDHATRAKQARAWTPPELVAYKTLTDKQSKVTPRLLGYREQEQESSALVPAGFLVSFAWEQVPGVQLGDSLGAKVFWDMSDDQRHNIREAFKNKTIRETETIGFRPLFSGPSHLVWDSASGNLFMVGFRQWIEVKPTPWSEAKSYWFDLAKPPKKVNWSEWSNNPDTSNWKF
ncbi:hypothetical protein PEX1_011740 [Penicillium expansum]|uniref:Uncharacterized protein n=1 Tax=Penicillium expansum TaxID=27334 RepID=A0A0A2L019_PENEN|nr:hypothetical protein PEX2_069190 [Penicillium expansum]KGO42495.1 hypothetical protein PEXP_023660 [Penicillium expansum]KGO58409.1 hypothetical protein PEX2_069190 [Penicillium expansum]KGO72496.1 hypothetical protein PEX1_011740 [Penicillium expansum]